MEQKDYGFEIVRVLIKGENYVRDIAKILNTNHMTVSRKVKELVKKNILDIKKEGRNKKYFLKRNVEARSFFLMEQQYFLIKLFQKGQLQIVEESEEICNSYVKKSASNFDSAKILLENNKLEEAYNKIIK